MANGTDDHVGLFAPQSKQTCKRLVSVELKLLSSELTDLVGRLGL